MIQSAVRYEPSTGVLPPELTKTIISEWPKWVATGVLIPVAQFLAGFIWRMRRKERIAQLRKSIVDVEDFISKHQSATGQADDTITTAKEERDTIVEQLRKLSRPFSEEHQKLSALAQFLLLYPPRYPITWITRICFFAGFANLYLKRNTFIAPRFPSEPVWFLLSVTFGFVFYNYLTRIGDRVSGPITARVLWRRVTLLYVPPNLAAGLSQFFYLVFICLALPLGYQFLADDYPDFTSEDLLVTLFVLPVLFFWYLAYHLDRKPDSKVPPDLVPEPNPRA